MQSSDSFEYCRWSGCPESQTPFNPKDLHDHLIEFHIGRKTGSSLCLTCGWAGCDKVFEKRDHIVSHSRVHVPSYRPFACAICQRKFSRGHDLRKHMKVHPRGDLNDGIAASPKPRQPMPVAHYMPSMPYQPHPQPQQAFHSSRHNILPPIQEVYPNRSAVDDRVSQSAPLQANHNGNPFNLQITNFTLPGRRSPSLSPVPSSISNSPSNGRSSSHGSLQLPPINQYLATRSAPPVMNYSTTVPSGYVVEHQYGQSMNNSNHSSNTLPSLQHTPPYSNTPPVEIQPGPEQKRDPSPKFNSFVDLVLNKM